MNEEIKIIQIEVDREPVVTSVENRPQSIEEKIGGPYWTTPLFAGVFVLLVRRADDEPPMNFTGPLGEVYGDAMIGKWENNQLVPMTDLDVGFVLSEIWNSVCYRS